MLFAVASALVNCTNSYDYEEPDPKMVELAKYAKQHVPEQHPKVREPLRGLGGLCVFGTRGPGPSAAASRLSGLLSLCIHTPRSVLWGGSPSPGPVGLGRSTKLPASQDKPAFVRARVKKLLAAGVVSAMTCMVKTESPVLTGSCRELLSR